MDRAECIGVRVVVIGEFCAGFAQGARMRKNLGALDEFLSMPVVDVLPVDRHVAGIFGEIVADLRRRGRPIPVNDIWIGAICAKAGATLVTFDAHFDAIQRIGTIIFE